MVFEYIDTDLKCCCKGKHPITKQQKICYLLALQGIEIYTFSRYDTQRFKACKNFIAFRVQDEVSRLWACKNGLHILVQEILTDYVATRWFRAPEILLGSKSYSFGVDMWSIGCMIGEMILGKALFSGTSTINQLEKIIEVLGSPTHEDIQSLGGQNQIFDKCPRNQKSNLKNILNCDDDELDLIKRLLVYDPNKRISVSEGLKQPYVREFQNPREEILFQGQLTLQLQDDKQYPVQQYRDLLYKKILILLKLWLLLINKKIIQNIASNRSDALKKQTNHQQFLNQQFAKSAFIDNLINQLYEKQFNCEY